MTISEIRAKYHKVFSLTIINQENLDKSLQRISELTDLKSEIDKAQEYVQNTALLVQQKISYDIEQIVNLALNAVFGTRYVFNLKFEIKRNKTEASLSLQENGFEIDLIEGGSGGVNDVLSFALRIALLLISKNRKVILLDEVMKGVSIDIRDCAYQILLTLSKELNLQCIMVSHDPLINDIADNIIEFPISPTQQSESAH